MYAFKRYQDRRRFLELAQWLAVACHDLPKHAEVAKLTGN